MQQVSDFLLFKSISMRDRRTQSTLSTRTDFKLVIRVLCCFLLTQLYAVADVTVLPLGQWSNIDIGTTGLSGSGTYNGDLGTYTLKGAGIDMWGSVDSFHFSYQELSGDGVIIARVASFTNTHVAAKIGVMIRQSLSNNSAHAMMMITPGSGVGLSYRKEISGLSASSLTKAIFVPRWLKLERHGNVLTGYHSADGVTWFFSQAVVINMSAKVYVGLAACSHDAKKITTAIVDNVSLIPRDSNALPWPWTEASIGKATDPGAALYDGSYFLSNLGADIWGTADRFKYISQSLRGDGSLVVRIATSTGDSRIGLMMREALNTNAKNVFLGSAGSTGVFLQSRRTAGGSTYLRPDLVAKIQKAPVWLKLVRAGDTFTASYSADGVTWTGVAEPEVIPMSETIRVGVAYFNRTSSWYLGLCEELKLKTPLDSDGNGLLDMWELRHFNLSGVDPTADIDGDGLTHAQEWELGCNPIVATPAGETPIVSVVSGDDQQVTTNSTMANPLVVKVTDARTGLPLSGVMVTFQIVSGPGKMVNGTVHQTTPVSLFSDENGLVQIRFKATSIAGPTVMQAYIGNQANGAFFNERTVLGSSSSGVSLDYADIGLGYYIGGTKVTAVGEARLRSDGDYELQAGNRSGLVGLEYDFCNYAYQTLPKDGVMVTRVTSVDHVVAYNAYNGYAGLMIRSSLAPNALQASVAVHATDGMKFFSRTTIGAKCGIKYFGQEKEDVPRLRPSIWMALRRSGKIVSAYYSKNGHDWVFVGANTAFSASEPLYIGLFHAASSSSDSATFDSVSTREVIKSPWKLADIGAFGAGGIDDFTSNSMTIRGSGSAIGGKTDSFRYIYQALPVDGRMIVRIESQANSSAWSKSGIMIRDNADPGSRCVLVAQTPGNGVILQARLQTGGDTAKLVTVPGLTAPNWLKLERLGSVIDAYQSADGQSWVKVGSVDWGFGSSLVGLATCSYNLGANSNTEFDNISLESFTGQAGWSASYFNDPVLSILGSSRRDATIDFDWAASQSPAPGITVNNYSIRWQAHILPKYSENYTFTTLSDGGIRLWIGGQLLMDNWNEARTAPIEATVQIALQAGSRPNVVIEYNNKGAGAGRVQLRWSSASQPDGVVPTACVQPTDTDNDGLPNDWEVTHKLSPLDPSDAMQISGDDDLSNLTRYQTEAELGNDKQSGVVLVEQWKNVKGDTLSYLTSLVAFPAQPTTKWLIRSPDPLQIEPGSSDYFGVRIRGYIKAPVTGVYKFWIAGDNEVAFWLSPSESPYDRVRVAYSTSYSWGFSDPAKFTKYSTQTSKDIALKADRYYYFEVLHKEGIGSDYVSVAWQIPNSGRGRELISSQYLASFTGRADTSLTSGKLSLGKDHGLALSSDGKLTAWGGNDYGQLGDGTQTDKEAPVNVGSLSGIAAVTAGKSHSVAIGTGGLLFTWGNNSKGQIGNGATAMARTTPFQVAAFTTTNAAVSASVGDGYTLACTADGKVWSWGDNSKGQLGVPVSTASRSLPAQVGGLTGVIAVAAGDTHSLALKSDGTVWAWGDNTDGQLGDGTKTLRTAPVQVICAGTQIALTDVVQIAAGINFSVARKADGTVFSWGLNNSGQLGDGTTTARLAAVQVSGLSGIWSICAGDTHALALRADGRVWGWGSNTHGELGSVFPLNRTMAALVPSLNDGVVLAAGGHRSGMVDVQGAVRVLGDNQFSRLGNTTTTYRVLPVTLTDTKQAASIYAGGAQGFVQRVNGKLFAWGANHRGQLAIGNMDPIAAPSPVYDNAVFRNTSAIAVGTAHTLILTQGMVVAAGENASGQLGDGSTHANIGVWITKLGSNVQAVAAGRAHSLALKSDGTVWAWGDNTHGQLGDDTIVRKLSPVPIGLSGVIAIAAGADHSLALKSDGSLWTWGSNDQGQLGDSTKTQRRHPVQVTLSSELVVKAISAGRAHSIALTNTGGVLTWGDDVYGQLGDGASGGVRTTPAPVYAVLPSTLFNTAVAIAAGEDHNIVLLADGSVRTWGRNDYGQLGLGTTDHKSAPAKPSIAKGTAIASGANTSYALLADGTVSVWGNNASHQLGYDSGRAVLLPLRLRLWPADADKDGMLDAWERLYAITMPLLDADGDGLLNIEEFDRGTDPKIVDSDSDLVVDFADSKPRTSLNADSLSLVILGGDNQAAVAGTFNAEPFDVAFWDLSGDAPVTDVSAKFTVLNSTGLLSASSSSATLGAMLSSKTDNDGTVQAYFQQPSTAGVGSYIRVQVGAESYDFFSTSLSAVTTAPTDSMPPPVQERDSADIDTDGDGVSDSTEAALGTNPAAEAQSTTASPALNLLLLTP
jgi:alpha-tubulin suppressor-like RCC1 family protein/regulation of enolase protein 1 (concanavalin A-like superfamily)